MKTLTINDEGHILLDGKKIEDMIAYKIENFASSSEPAKLTVTIYVEIGKSGC